MLKLENMKLGDKVYIVKETNNAFSSEKIEMIDEDGIHWYRYDKLLWDYHVEEVEYCGKVTYNVEGEIRFDKDRHLEYHFKYGDGQIYPEYVWAEDPWVEDPELWFATREEAEKYASEMKEIKNATHS